VRTTGYPDTESPEGDVGRLRVDVCKNLSAKKLGIRKDDMRVDDLARLFHIHRAHFYRLCNGERIASLPLAIHMSDVLGTKVEKLFITKVGTR
jgi:DNA-binding XRE family transcriptional regulator